MDELSFGFPPADEQSAKRTHTAELATRAHLRPVFGADYRGLVADLVESRLDAAWLPPLALLRAERRVRPVAVFERAGKGSYHGALVARRDSGLVGLRDLAGKRVGWVDADSAAGCVLTRALIRELQPDIDQFLGPQRFLGSHRAVVQAVLDGEVDVGATFLNFGRDGTIVLSGWQEFLGDRARELGPIAITGSIPGDVIAVREGLPREQAQELVATLRGLASEPVFAQVFNGAHALADPKPGEHDLLAELAARAGWRP